MSVSKAVDLRNMPVGMCVVHVDITEPNVR